MKIRIPIEHGVFYSVEDGYAMFTEDSEPSTFELGTKYELNSMFEMWALTKEGSPIGFYFYSAFKSENKGGYIITYMENKRGKAKDSKVVIRLPSMIVYDIPGCGAIAVSTKVNSKVESIFVEQ